MEWIVTGIALVSVVLIALLASRPQLTRGHAGKAIAFVAMFVLPSLVTAVGVQVHLERAKSTEFCLSCHEMEPYGESLHVADPTWVAANHFLSNRVARDQACYTCHTQYTMFGDVNAKLAGLKHLWIHYTGDIPETIELYQPYNNRECLHCHGAARNYLENEFHDGMIAEMASGEVSCLDCHGPVHDVESVDDMEIWEAP
ncbi:MAG: NapC/NirT family cytochrome c [Acidobacteriota bacterium]